MSEDIFGNPRRDEDGIVKVAENLHLTPYQQLQRLKGWAGEKLEDARPYIGLAVSEFQHDPEAFKEIAGGNFVLGLGNAPSNVGNGFVWGANTFYDFTGKGYLDIPNLPVPFESTGEGMASYIGFYGGEITGEVAIGIAAPETLISRFLSVGRRAPSIAGQSRVSGFAAQAVKYDIPWTTELNNVVLHKGFRFELDDLGRVTSASTRLRLGNGTRDQKLQLAAGGVWRRGDDQGGHIFAKVFGGPAIDLNHFAQNGNFNMGVFRTFEKSLADSLGNGDRIFIRHDFTYTGKSLRPDALMSTTRVNEGKPVSVKFGNERKGLLPVE